MADVNSRSLRPTTASPAQRHQKRLPKRRRAASRRLLLEPLEDRRVLAPLLYLGMDTVTIASDGTLNATLIDGTLTVADSDPVGLPNALTVSRVDANLVITNTTEQFGSAPVGGTLSNNSQTLTIPLASITGSLLTALAGGDDVLTVDFSGGNPLPTAGLNYDGGTGSDRLVLAGGEFHTSTFTYANANDGSIAFDPDGPGGTTASVISYTGLEPITSSVASTSSN